MNRDTLSKSPLFFPSVGCAILKDFSYLFHAKFAGRKFYRWRHDNWPIGQWVTFHSAPDTAYVNHFFPHEFIVRFISIQAKQVDLKASSLARLLRDLMHWSSLRSLLRTYQRSTCRTSRTGSEVGNKNFHTVGDGSASAKEITSSPGLSHFFRVNRKSLGDEVAKNISFVSNRFTLGV